MHISRVENLFLAQQKQFNPLLIAQNFFASSFGHAHLYGGDECKVCFYFLYLKISTFLHKMFKISSFE